MRDKRVKEFVPADRLRDGRMMFDGPSSGRVVVSFTATENRLLLPAASDEDEGVMFADDGFWVKVDPAGR
jgi:hypothetical protein